MKTKKWYLIFVAISIGVLLSNCKSEQSESTTDLIVVEQIDSVFGDNGYNNYEWAAFSVDVPVNGPKTLVDSVMVLINREVYKMCEYCIEFVDSPDEYVAYCEEDIYTDDGKLLLKHYLDRYRASIADSLWNTFGLTLKMEAQTAKYVTYGMEFFHCGASCGSEKYYYTFDKNDGHIVKEIITNDNLVKFFKDYPRYVSKNEYSWRFSPEDTCANTCFGLLQENFSLAIVGLYNHFFTVDVPLSQILPYMSLETQELVERQSKGK